MIEAMYARVAKKGSELINRARWFVLCNTVLRYHGETPYKKLPEHLKKAARFSEAIGSAIGSKSEPRTPFRFEPKRINGRMVLWEDRSGRFTLDETDRGGEVQYAQNVQILLENMIFQDSPPKKVDSFIEALVSTG
jgi:hypothetical protein